MTTRRQFLGSTAIAGAALATGAFALVPLVACSQPPPAAAPPETAAMPVTGGLQTRAIPSSNEQLPVIGMGTSGSFEVGASAGERDPLRDVLALFFAAHARVIDTSPNYGAAEDVLGDLLAERKAHAQCFIATKLATEGRDAGLAQFQASLRRLRAERIDLLQVHNLRDWRTQIAVAKELKAQARIRYTGLTHYRDDAHDALMAAMQSSRPDFVQVNYSVVSRNAERRLLPMARDLGIAVIVNRAFEDGRLFGQVRDKPVPGWAIDAGADSWAQLFLKFVLADPAVTVVIPATGKPKNQADNLRAGLGPMLDAKQRAALVAALG